LTALENTQESSVCICVQWLWIWNTGIEAEKCTRLYAHDSGQT